MSPSAATVGRKHAKVGIFRIAPISPRNPHSYDWPYCVFTLNDFKRPIMELSVALETSAVSLALLCLALVPVAIRRDPGLARPIVRIDGLRRPRWPNFVTRAGIACLLVSFAMLLSACYLMLADARV
ncbi:hypothetical protein QFZ39_003078 [Paraburkholderia graminis]|jgi:hypothetical protein|uniref:Transmembrane protein n=1 Tax=Paraburkholderia graminis TaxID=60548 RepID=A0ABD5CF41_9BURK|nr:hypothetical protein [Paraburkholderia graminis]MDR6203175.1 hypothetical protein [Paraburkholderia graminis]